jgi:hypothetical protein
VGETLRASLEDPGQTPALEPLVHRVPIAELLGQVPPRQARARQEQQSLKEQAVGQFRLGTRARALGPRHQRSKDFPDRIRQHQTHGEPSMAAGEEQQLATLI